MAAVADALNGVEHSFLDWEVDDDYHCELRVALSNGSTETVTGTGRTQHHARSIAIFKATCAIKASKAAELRNLLEEGESPENGVQDIADVEAQGVCSVKADGSEPEQGTKLVFRPAEDDPHDAEQGKEHAAAGPALSLTPAKIGLTFVPAADEHSDVEVSAARQQSESHAIRKRKRPKHSRKLYFSSSGDSDVLGTGKPSQKAVYPTAKVSSDESGQSRQNLASSRQKKMNQVDLYIPSEPFKRKVKTGCEPPTKRSRSDRKHRHSSDLASRGLDEPQPRRKGRSNYSGRYVQHRARTNGYGNSGRNEPPRLPRQDVNYQYERNQFHNAEVHLARGRFNENDRIPRVTHALDDSCDDVVLVETMAQSHKHVYASTMGMTHGNTVPALDSDPPYGQPHPTGVYPPVFSHPVQTHLYIPPHTSSQLPMRNPHYAPPPAPSPYAMNGPHGYMPIMQQPYPPPGIPNHGIPSYPYPLAPPDGQMYPHYSSSEMYPPNSGARIPHISPEELAKVHATSMAKIEAEKRAKQDHDRMEASSATALAEGYDAEDEGKTGKVAIRKKPAPPAQRERSTPLGNSGVSTTVVDSLPPEREDDGVDYVSRVNMIAQKGKHCTSLASNFVQLRLGSDPGCGGWRCKMSVKLLPPSENGEHEILERNDVARSRRRAKQWTAKALLSALEELIDQRLKNGSDKDVNSVSPEVLKARELVSGTKSGSAILQKLWQAGCLACPPDFRHEQHGGSDSDQWKCFVTFSLRGEAEKRMFDEVGCSKKLSKHLVALKAVNELANLGISTAQGYVKALEVAETTEVAEYKSLADCANASDAIVHTSDEESVADASDVDIESRDSTLLLPKDYRVVIARSEDDCEAWFKEFGKRDAEFGLFIESKEELRMFENRRQESGIEQGNKEIRYPILCFSTSTSALVIFPNVRFVEDKSTAQIPHDDDEFRLPGAVELALENPRWKMHGLFLDEGLDRLRYGCGLEPRSVNDVAVTSLAIAGVGKVTGGYFPSSLKQLVKFWLQKDIGEASGGGIWAEKSDSPVEMQEKSDGVLGLGVLCSYACFCLHETIAQSARRKRMQMYGTAAEFTELSKRLMETVES